MICYTILKMFIFFDINCKTELNKEIVAATIGCILYALLFAYFGLNNIILFGTLFTGELFFFVNDKVLWKTIKNKKQKEEEIKRQQQS